MYHRYFGLQEIPFSIAVNPRYLFMSARHKDALAHLLYGVGSGGGFILLTGEVGTGKTTINRALLRQLPDTTDIALVLNPALNAVELLATVCDELHIAYTPGEQSLKQLTDALHRFLLDNHQRGRNTVLLIDEAQHLQFDVLEQIRLLTNLETESKKLLQIILVGQPELEAMLARPQLRQLSQRITARYRLKPLNLDETDAYIRHRLQVAGLPAGQTLFSLAIVKEIHRLTGGVPRLINVICDRALLGAYGQHKPVVDTKMLAQAAREVMGEEPELKASVRGSWRATAMVSGALVVLATVLAMGWMMASERTVSPVLTQTVAPLVEDVATVSEAPPAADAVASTNVAQPAMEPQPAITEAMTREVPADTTQATTPDGWRSEPDALNALLQIRDARNVALASPCEQAAELSLRCQRLQAASWDDVLAFNRPVVLELLTPGRFKVYTALLSVQGDSGRFLTASGEQTLPLETVGREWSGWFVLFWSPGPLTADRLVVGDRGLTVRWLAEQFAVIDGQSQRLTETVFNESLEARVKIFQRQHGLREDGVVGMQTLLKLQDAIGSEVPLMTDRSLSGDEKPALNEVEGPALSEVEGSASLDTEVLGEGG